MVIEFFRKARQLKRRALSLSLSLSYTFEKKEFRIIAF